MHGNCMHAHGRASASAPDHAEEQVVCRGLRRASLAHQCALSHPRILLQVGSATHRQRVRTSMCVGVPARVGAYARVRGQLRRAAGGQKTFSPAADVLGRRGMRRLRKGGRRGMQASARD